MLIIGCQGDLSPRRRRGLVARRGGASGNASKSELDSFGLLDRNADGKISRSEFGATLASLGETPSEAELSEIMREVDVDGDGSVSLDEWVEAPGDGSGDAAARDDDDDDDDAPSPSTKRVVAARAAPRGVKVIDDAGDLDGEVFFNVQLDPLRVLASAATAARALLRSAWATLFGGGGAKDVVATAGDGAGGDPGVGAAWPGAAATAAKAARQALDRGSFALVVGAPPGEGGALSALLRDGALGDLLRGKRAAVLDGARSEAAYARCAALASKALPVALPKRAAFLALAVPRCAPGGAVTGLEALAVFRHAAHSKKNKAPDAAAVAKWLSRALDAHSGALDAVKAAKSELDLADEQQREIRAAVADDRKAAAAAAADRARRAARDAARAERALEAERKAANDLTRRADLAKTLLPEATGMGVSVKLKCPDGDTRTRKFPPDATAKAVLDWVDVCGVDLDRYAVRKAAGDRKHLDDPDSNICDVLGARALLECVDRGGH